MKYKVLVLDIDGTLVNSKKEITPATKEGIALALDKGVKVVIASGRPTPGVIPIARELELTKRGGYILSFNGGKIINCQTKEIIYEKNISKDLIPVLEELADYHKVNMMTYEEEAIITKTPNDSYIAIEADITKLPIKGVNSFSEYVTFPVPKCIMTGDGDYLETVEPKVRQAVGEQLNVFRSEPFFLEIMPKNIDKAYCLGKLLEHFNLTREEMIACGDGFNDKSMIEFAGLGVAMENAQPVIKEVADYITVSNDEDGVRKVIDQFILS